MSVEGIVVERCDHCEFYEVNGDVMSATCRETGRSLALATASPYVLSAKAAIPPRHCPLRIAPIERAVRLKAGI